MNSTNNQLLFAAASTILESAQILQKGAKKGKEAMNNFSRFSAAVHSFQVYTFMDPNFENLKELTAFKEAVKNFEEYYIILRNVIDVEAKQKEAVKDFEILQQSLVTLKEALHID